MFNGGFKGVRAADGAGFVSARDVAVQQSNPQPKITSWAYTNGAYVPYPDTAIVGGETIVIYGSGFQSNANVVIGGTTVTSTRLDPNRITFTAPSLSAGSYPLYVANPGGGTAVYLPGVVYNSYPVWNSTSYANTFTSATSSVAFGLNVTGSPSLTFSLQSGSSLPTGLTLAANGYISGSTTVSNTTVYNFTVIATDSYAQAAQASITYTITYVITDINFNYTTLLLNGETNTNTYIQDASANNFAVIPYAGSVSNRFSPFWGDGYYGNSFDGSTGYLNVPSGIATNFSNSNFTIEMWLNNNTAWNSGNRDIITSSTTNALQIWVNALSGVIRLGAVGVAGIVDTPVNAYNNYNLNAWNHFAWVRNGNTFNVYVNGTSVGSGTNSLTFTQAAYTIGGGPEGSYSGYMSNFRIVIGTAVYTSNFTPSTAPLTAIANTVLLTCQSNRFIDNSPNSLAITPSGTVKVIPNHPFGNVQTSATANTNGQGYYSGAIIGGSNLLSYPTSLNLGTAPFTIEFWFYISSLGNSGIYFLYDYVNNSSRWTVQWNGPGWAIGHYDGGSWVYTATSTSSVTLGQWTHLAITRDSSSTMRVYVNGVLGGTTANFTRNFTNSGSSKTILNDPTGDGTATGFMSNLRIVNGTALYTGSSFTPSTTPLTAVAGTTMLTLQNSTFIDNSANNNVLTPTGAPYVSQNQPFSSPPVTSNTLTPNIYGSVLLDGSTGYLQVQESSNPAFALSGDFTIELWYYPTGTSGGYIYAQTVSGTNWCIVSSSTTVGTAAQFTATTSGGGTPQSSAAVGNPYSWNHLAVCRKSGQVTVYLNGVGGASVTNNTSIPSTYLPTISGYSHSQTGLFAGYISNIRVINGTALYTNNFLPPTSPLTAIPNTSLLSLQYKNSANNNVFYDDSTNNFSLTRTGTPTQGTFSPFSQTGWSTLLGYGTYGYFSAPANTGYDITGGNFTVEFWANFTTWNTMTYSGTTIIGNFTSSNGWYVGFNGGVGSSFNFTVYTSGSGATATSTGIVAGTNFQLGTWNHFAIQQSGSTIYFYLNGSLTYSTTAPTGTGAGSGLYIGAYAQNFTYAGNAIVSYSNMRIVKGSTVYATSGFTVPTSPLTAISGTTFLAFQNNRHIDNSSINATLTSVSSGTNPIIQPFSPFAPGVSYSSANNGGSIYFNGSSYLTNSSFPAIGTNDFTIEYWLYLTSQATRIVIVPTSSTGLVVLTNSSGQVVLGVYGTDQLLTGSLTLNQWYHIAITRQSGTARIFINGALSTSGSVSTSYTGGTCYIGSDGTTFTNGYISNLRVIIGNALYTSAFTPPTAPVTPIANTSLLLLGTNTGIQDATGKNDIVALGSAKTQANTVKFGSSAMYFDGSTGYLTSNINSNYQFGTGNFTVECWVNLSSLTGYQTLLTFGYTPLTAYGWAIQSGNGNGNWLWVYLNSTPSTVAVITESGSTVNTNTWYHIAVVRNGTTLTMYRNGVSVGTASDTGNYTASATLGIGAGSGTGFNNYYLNGYIDDLRITKGIARYTGNFTPPAYQFLAQ